MHRVEVALEDLGEQRRLLQRADDDVGVGEWLHHLIVATTDGISSGLLTDLAGGPDSGRSALH